MARCGMGDAKGADRDSVVRDMVALVSRRK